MMLAERLEAHSMYEPMTGCKLWLGGLQHGYGNIKIAGRTKLVHRVAWEAQHGPIEEGKQIDHKCRVRSCINVAHLEPVTMHENKRRGLQGVLRQPKTHCINGHAYIAENSYNDRKGVVRCMQCARESRLRSYRRIRNGYINR